MLPNNLERKLNLAGRCLRGVDEPSACDSMPVLVKDRKIVGR